MNRTPITQGPAYESQTENESSDACISSKERIYPRVANNKDRKPMFIVQNKEFSFNQSYTILKCNLRKSCTIFDHIGSPPPGNKCQQKYGHVSMTVYDTKTRAIREDDFYIPSCCVCEYNTKSVFPIKVRRS